MATPVDLVEQIGAWRSAAGRSFFAAEAERLAAVCHRMAERFARGGRLVALGADPVARSDARHVAVEFVHPVIVGKRALPALALGAEGGPLVPQVELLCRPDDIVLAFGGDPETARAIRLARERGALTLAFQALGAEQQFIPDEDADTAQELVETLYHVLWELVHVFFDHRGLLEGRDPRRTHDPGAASFLYPFLSERETGLDAVLDDVRASVLMKAEEIGALRERTMAENAGVILAAADTLRERLGRGGTLLAIGNGGSATDAMDAVADYRATGSSFTPRPAVDLTEDPGILTAILNDIGAEAVFARQVIAHGGEPDVLLSFSTSGNSGNVLAALVEARRRGLATIAMVGYDGGRIATEDLADHIVVVRSEHIPRIQEAQATVHHVLRGLVG